MLAARFTRSRSSPFLRFFTFAVFLPSGTGWDATVLASIADGRLPPIAAPAAADDRGDFLELFEHAVLAKQAQPANPRQQQQQQQSQKQKQKQKQKRKRKQKRPA